jgi:cell fate regulator YaaT (PSP1 superfamily)
VDFRALVRELAREYRTRIEMKQIGARDEAKLLGNYEHCGRELCCRRFMRTLEPVTIKMAKNQKATLDPAKISGACGRLMCCLRFENPIYQELKSQLPRKGSKVRTPKGMGEVINYDIIAQTVLVEESSGDKVTYRLEDLSLAQGTSGQQGEEDARDAGRTETGKSEDKEQEGSKAERGATGGARTSDRRSEGGQQRDGTDSRRSRRQRHSNRNRRPGGTDGRQRDREGQK